MRLLQLTGQLLVLGLNFTARPDADCSFEWGLANPPIPQPSFRGVIEQHRLAAADGPITDELATLRALADTVRRNDTQIRRIVRD